MNKLKFLTQLYVKCKFYAKIMMYLVRLHVEQYTVKIGYSAHYYKLLKHDFEARFWNKTKNLENTSTCKLELKSAERLLKREVLHHLHVNSLMFPLKFDSISAAARV